MDALSEASAVASCSYVYGFNVGIAISPKSSAFPVPSVKRTFNTSDVPVDALFTPVVNTPAFVVVNSIVSPESKPFNVSAPV